MVVHFVSWDERRPRPMLNDALTLTYKEPFESGGCSKGTYCCVT